MRIAAAFLLLAACGGRVDATARPTACTGLYPTDQYACVTNPDGPGSDVVLIVDGVTAMRCTCEPGCTAVATPDAGSPSAFGCPQ